MIPEMKPEECHRHYNKTDTISESFTLYSQYTMKQVTKHKMCCHNETNRCVRSQNA